MPCRCGCLQKQRARCALVRTRALEKAAQPRYMQKPARARPRTQQQSTHKQACKHDARTDARTYSRTHPRTHTRMHARSLARADATGMHSSIRAHRARCIYTGRRADTQARPRRHWATTHPGTRSQYTPTRLSHARRSGVARPPPQCCAGRCSRAGEEGWPGCAPSQCEQ